MEKVCVVCNRIEINITNTCSKEIRANTLGNDDHAETAEMAGACQKDGR